MHPDLKKLLDTYPLSPRWSSPELFLEEVKIEKMRISCAGLVSQEASGIAVTGSAAARSEVPLIRSYFELIERTSIVEAEESGLQMIPLRDIAGKPKEEVPRSIVFPKSPNPESWVYARSNGVAAHIQWHLACRSAAEEMIERDHLLRSWYGQIRPEPIPRSATPAHPELEQSYEFMGYHFAEPPPKSDTGFALMTSVVGVFGFPRRPGIPMIYGFAARSTETEALNAADRECVQRLSFLWGEELPAALPEFAPTGDYHQEAFLAPDGSARLRDWLRGDHQRYIEPQGAKAGLLPRTIFFVDLTPPHLCGKLFVVKAVSQAYLPLTFGYCQVGAMAGLPRELLIHPVA